MGQMIELFDRLIANSYEDEVEGVSTQRAADEGTESGGTDFDNTFL